MYATLKAASITCPTCGRKTQNDWQFCYGSCGNLPEYSMGDRVSWEHQCFGEPTDEVYAVAYPAREFACEHCKNENFLALIHIVNSRINGIEFYKEKAWVQETILGPDKKRLIL